EPTSGLAADDTQALVQLLADLAKQTGKTIVTTIHQPSKEEFEKFNQTLILGPGGLTTFFGPPKDGYKFFGSFKERLGKHNDVDNPRDMFDMLNQRERPIFEAMRAQNPNTPRNMQPTPDHSAALFFCVVSAVWFGTSNAAREVVSERAIYMRERMVNLKLFNYIFSKFLLLSVFCIIQCTILLAIVFFALG